MVEQRKEQSRNRAVHAHCPMQQDQTQTAYLLYSQEMTATLAVCLTTLLLRSQSQPIHHKEIIPPLLMTEAVHGAYLLPQEGQ